MLQVSFIPPQTIWRALLVGRYVRIVSSLLRRWKTRNSKSRIDLAGSSGPLLDGLTVSPIRMGSRRFADSLVCEYSVIKKTRKKRGEVGERKSEIADGGKRKGEREIRFGVSRLATVDATKCSTCADLSVALGCRFLRYWDRYPGRPNSKQPVGQDRGGGGAA